MYIFTNQITNKTDSSSEKDDCSQKGVLTLKRAFHILLVLALLLGAALPVTASGTPALSISSGEVKAGETVTLTVSIKDNPGIAASLLYIYYDTDSFTVDVSKGIFASGAFASNGSVIGNTIDAAKDTGRYDGVAGKDGVLALWYNSSGIDTSDDGNMLKIKFTANKDIANGDHVIQVGYSKTDTQNQKGEQVSLVSAEGIISVTGGSDQKKPEEKPEQETIESVEFKDISGHWAETYIRQSAELGLVEGYEGLYRPDDTMTRAEFVTILWRAVGEPEPKGKASFSDLKQDWYFKSVAWAEENNVVNGMGGGLFDPAGSVTREQLVTILHRMAGTPTGMELMVSTAYDQQYADSEQIGDWAKAALYWSVFEGIYCGENSESIGDRLAPKRPANRAQIAVMMIRYLKEQ